jgi:ferredoxin--NADP+ reductase
MPIHACGRAAPTNSARRCFEECPVDAIHYEDDLPGEQLGFQQINAEYFRNHPLEPATAAAST